MLALWIQSILFYRTDVGLMWHHRILDIQWNQLAGESGEFDVQAYSLLCIIYVSYLRLSGSSRLMLDTLLGYKNMDTSFTTKYTIRIADRIEINPPILVPSDRSLGTFLNISSLLNLRIMKILNPIDIIGGIEKTSFLLNATIILNSINKITALIITRIIESLHDLNFAIEYLSLYLHGFILYFLIRSYFCLHFLYLFLVFFYLLFYLYALLVLLVLYLFAQLFVLLPQFLYWFNLFFYFFVLLL